MTKPLRVLLLEDSEDDALLLQRELTRGGYAPKLERVDTRQGMQEALARQMWDVVISDYVMPNFSAPEALKLLKESGIDLPFIIVSGAIGEEIAVAAMRGGAHDYLMKGHLARLVPAIEREMHEASNRRERRRVEEISARLGRILDNSSNEILVFDAHSLRLLQANRGACQNLGYTMAELEQLTPLDLQPDMSPVDFTELLAPLRRGETDMVVFETIQRRKDGSTYPVEVRLHLSQSEAPAVFVAIVQNISERKQAEQRLSFLAEASTVLASSLDYELTLQRLTELAVPILGDCAVAYVVRRDETLQRLAVAYTDSTRKEVRQRLRQVFPDHPRAPALIHEVLRTGMLRVFPRISEEYLSAAGNDPAFLQLEQLGLRSLLLVPLLAREQTLGVLAFMLGDSGRSYESVDVALAEEVARRAAGAVDNAWLYQEAKQALRARDQFLSIAAHELKTPITALLGYTHLLERRAEKTGALGERDLSSLRSLGEQVQRLQKLTNSLFDLSRIQTGQLTIERRPLELGPLVLRVVDELSPSLEKHSFMVLQPDEPLRVDGDELRLHQVLQNLLQNAVKYSPSGGEIIVRLARYGAQAEIAVVDPGIGIPAEALPRLFSRFYRANNIDPDQIGGMGLGLYVVKEIVSLHGGSVAVESLVGQGSTFRVRLPLFAPASEAPTPPVSSPVAAPAATPAVVAQPAAPESQASTSGGEQPARPIASVPVFAPAAPAPSDGSAVAPGVEPAAAPPTSAMPGAQDEAILLGTHEAGE